MSADQQDLDAIVTSLELEEIDRNLDPPRPAPTVLGARTPLRWNRRRTVAR